MAIILRNIRLLRRHKGFSAKDFASRLGMRYNYYMQLETGYLPLKEQHLQLIAKELDVDVGFLYTEGLPDLLLLSRELKEAT